MPPGFQLLDDFVSSITYEFSPQDGAVSRMFDALTKEAGEHGILDWGISQTRCAGGAAPCRWWLRPATDPPVARRGALAGACRAQPGGRVPADYR